METLEELGRYRVLAPIGRGGMGTVFAGHHVVLQRPVAIKVLHAHLATESAMARRMLEEARTIAGLQHPGIVEVLDVGMTDDGRTYVVMERLAGEVLGDRLHRARLPEERAVAFARQLASALAVAHGAGVIHRDLKPDNIFIVPDPDIAGGERVKILDFGIAKRMAEPSGTREQTQTGVVLGTPAYMAPEQCTGTDLDGRADIYALGVVMYLMVTGELPFDGASTEEIFAEHVFCAPRPPAALAPVSAGFAVIIDRCLAKRPADRFASMDALALELEILQAGAGSDPSPVTSRATTTVPFTSSFPLEAPLPAHTGRHVAHSGRYRARARGTDTPPGITISSPTASPRVTPLDTGARAGLPQAITRATTTPVARLATEPERRSWWRGVALTSSAIAAGVAAALVVRMLAGPGTSSAVVSAATPPRAEALVSSPSEPAAERTVRASRERDSDRDDKRAARAAREEKRDAERDERADKRAERADKNRSSRVADRARDQDRSERRRPARSRVAEAEDKRDGRAERESNDRPRRSERASTRGDSSGRTPANPDPSFARVAPPTLY